MNQANNYGSLAAERSPLRALLVGDCCGAILRQRRAADCDLSRKVALPIRSGTRSAQGTELGGSPSLPFR
jgi:hypothetical protein